MTEGTSGGSTRLWGGRFAERPDQSAESFTASIMFDNRMVREDIRGSVAHVRMLGRQGIIPADDAATIEAGLWQVWDDVEAGAFAFSVADEDIHTAVERRLRELIGAAQGKLHTGRSRNDQVATDTRMWTKFALLRVAQGVHDLGAALANQAAANVDVPMPGYTHTQRAQPVLFAHHMLAYVEMLRRDAERLQQAWNRADVMPLGSGAMAGVTYPIDRASVAADLGFGAISRNSMDAIADRDFVLDALYALSMIQLHISRLCEELIWWSSGEFRFIQVSDAFSTGSSIMPQKKNPDVAEIARGKTGRVVGNLMGTFMMVKGLPLTFNSDMQEDKESLYEAVDTVEAVLPVMTGMLASMKVNRERLAEAAIGDFSLATDAADLLARNGVAFREAHEVVGRLVRSCIDQNKTFEDLTDEEWAALHPVFAAQKPPLTALESINARDIPGGTATPRVSSAIEEARQGLTAMQQWIDREMAARTRTFSRNSPGASPR
ncbi:MAG: argininosuccinate lyase [Thermomicrobiales bacterium]|nr:argininosuccinate lyase [Thermomicrobiales bacterium]